MLISLNSSLAKILNGRPQNEKDHKTLLFMSFRAKKVDVSGLEEIKMERRASYYSGIWDLLYENLAYLNDHA